MTTHISAQQHEDIEAIGRWLAFVPTISDHRAARAHAHTLVTAPGYDRTQAIKDNRIGGIAFDIPAATTLLRDEAAARMDMPQVAALARHHEAIVRNQVPVLLRTAPAGSIIRVSSGELRVVVMHLNDGTVMLATGDGYALPGEGTCEVQVLSTPVEAALLALQTIRP